jgi:serine phosphatase RsbU (regulator of sigma subunit)/putative methionine-R-sulfoxide reductase with GAF domain
LTLLQQVIDQLAHQPLDDGLLTNFLCLIQREFNHYRFFLYAYDAAEKLLRLKVCAEKNSVKYSKNIRQKIPLGDGPVGTAAETKQQVWIQNTTKGYKQHRGLPRLSSARSEACFPLFKNDHVIGVLDVQSDSISGFDPHELVLLRILSDVISSRLSNSHFIEALRKRVDHLTAVTEVSRLLTSILNLEDLLHQVVNLIREKFNYPYVHCFVLDDSGSKLTFMTGTGEISESLKEKEFSFNVDDPRGILPHVARTGNSYIANEVNQDPLYREIPLPPAHTCSEMAVPLKFGDEILGVLDIQSDQSFAFNDDDRFTLEALASSISVALHNARLYQSSIQQTWISTVFQQFTETIRDQEDIPSLADSVTRTTPLLLSIRYCALFLRDKFSGVFNLISHSGFNSKQVDYLKSIPQAKEGLKIIQKLLNQPTDAVQMRPSLHDTNLFQGEVFWLFPLTSGNELLGIFLVNSSPDRNDSSMQEAQEKINLILLQSIAHQTAVAFENIQLKESNQMEAYVTAVLLQVAQISATSPGLGETIQTITESIPFLVGAETILIYTYDTAQASFLLHGANSTKFDKELLNMEEHIRKGEFPLLDDLIIQQKSKYLLHENIPPGEWPLRLHAQPVFTSLKMIGEHHDVLFAIPLVLRGESFGVMLLAENSENYLYREKRHEIITGVSQQLALAIQDDLRQQEVLTSERLKREIQLAQQIQRTFLPDQLPHIPNWDLDVRWRPALQVSGDFYDLVHLPDGRWGLVIADVSDKGLAAALYMTVTRTLVHASALDGDLPAKTLLQVNQLLLDNSQEGLFTTIFYALLDVANGEIIYCNAGHNSPLVLRARTQQLEVVGRGGTALGTLADIHLEDEWLVLQPADSLILYTDGVTEARGTNDKLFGISRLKKLLCREMNRNIYQLLDDLDAELARFTLGRNPSDDVTVMGLQRIK